MYELIVFLPLLGFLIAGIVLLVMAVPVALFVRHRPAES